MINDFDIPQMIGKPEAPADRARLVITTNDGLT